MHLIVKLYKYKPINICMVIMTVLLGFIYMNLSEKWYVSDPTVTVIVHQSQRIDVIICEGIVR